MFGINNFFVTNLTFFNANQDETNYDKNEYAIFYINGFNSSAITSMLMINIYSP